MKVLWIAQNGGNYKQNIIKGTGGWIGALQSLILQQSDVSLGICFPHEEDYKIIHEGEITYMPYIFNTGHNIFQKLLYHLKDNNINDERYVIEQIIKRIKKFKPDVIHIWGLEFIHSAVIPYLEIPYIVHIQGLTSLYINTYCPPNFSPDDIRKSESWINNIINRGLYFEYTTFCNRAERELKIAPHVRNWIGRTDWDKVASKILSPNSSYYHCEEVMRTDFLKSQWHYHYNGVLNIQTNISDDWYKGVDVILKTAKILKKNGVDFVWNIYGIQANSKKVSYISKKINIKPDDVNVFLRGRVDAKTICDSLLKSDVYVHSSYVENSSNAIAEAMMLGVPTIAQYVGGNPTMLRDNSGILVAPNEPYEMVHSIMSMMDENMSAVFSQRALNVSALRQNNDIIVEKLLSIYDILIHNFK